MARLSHISNNESLATEELAPLALLLLVAITIAITVAIAILFTLGAAIVDDNAKMIENLFLVQALQLGQVTTVNFRLTQDINGEVGNTIDDASIGNNLSRNIIYNHIIIHLLELFDTLFQAVAHQQFSRVRSHDAGRQDVKIALLALSDNKALHIVDITRKV